jgi:hypothetical protein
MAAKISTDMINRRLGSTMSQSPGQQSNDVESFDDDVAEGDDAESMGLGFILTTVATCLALGLGTFFWMNGSFSLFDWQLKKDNLQFASKADGFCKKLWKSPGWNNEALACYMVEEPQRLCDADERNHLVALISQFRLDAELAKGKALNEVMFNQKKIFADIQKEIDNFDNPNYKRPEKPKVKKATGKQYLKQRSIEENVASFQKKVMGGAPLNQNLELSDLLRNLIVAGYFEHRYDFGLLNDQIVADAYADPVPPVTSPCPKPTV